MQVSSSNIGQSIARQGIHTMRQQPGESKQADMGELFLGSIEEQSSSQIEKDLVRASREIAGKAKVEKNGWFGKVEHDHGNVRKTVSWAALNVVCDGVTGPLSAALAEVGYLTMLNCREQPSEPLARVGSAFTEAIRDTTTDPLVKAKAEASLLAASSVEAHHGESILFGFLAEQGSSKYGGSQIG